ncbi:hypothetical protein ACROYT_G033219 [Oculina patagonica]
MMNASIVFLILFVAVCSAARVPFPRRSEVDEGRVLKQELSDRAGDISHRLIFRNCNGWICVETKWTQHLPKLCLSGTRMQVCLQT